MKKFLAFLGIVSILALIALGITSFDLVNFTNKPQVTSTPLSKVKVKPFLSQNEDYSENISKGDSYAQKGYGTLAIQAYTLANKVFPGKSEPYKKIGAVYFKNANFEKAQENLSKSVELNSNDAEAIVLLSRTHFRNENIGQAEELLKKYVDKGDSVKLHLAYILIVNQKYEDAKALLEEVKNNENGSEENKNSADKFLKSFEGYDFSRGAPPVYLQTLLAKNLTQVDGYELAIPLLRSAIEQKSEYRDAWILLGYSYLNSQRPLDAIEALKEALTLAPEKPETRYLLSLAHFYNQNVDEAIDNMEIALQNDFQPEKEALLKLAEMYLIAEKYESAARSYEKLLELDSRNVELFIKPVWIYLEHLNNNEEALRFAQKAQENHPTSAMSYNLVGWVQTKKGEFTEGKANLDKAIEIDPELDAAYLNLGLWNEKQNRIEDAKKNYKAAYEKGDGNSIANLAAIRYNNLIRNNSN